jgi:hypothetical protein
MDTYATVMGSGLDLPVITTVNRVQNKSARSPLWCDCPSFFTVDKM